MIKVELKENERIDELQRNGYVIIQNQNTFCFGMDAVLLAAFANVKAKEEVLDLGTGTGVIPLLMEARNKQAKHFTGLEIQDVSVDMATRSVFANGLFDRIDIIKGDIKDVKNIFGGKKFDCITSNPPYMPNLSGLKNPQDTLAIARHEVLVTLDDVVSSASSLLNQGKRFYMVHRPQRLVTILDTLRKNRLEPKRLRLVHPYKDKEANMILVEAIKDGKEELRVMPPLIIYDEAGAYTKEVKEIYTESGII